MISAGENLKTVGTTESVRLPQWLDPTFLSNQDVSLVQTSQKNEGQYRWTPLTGGCVFLRQEDPGPTYLQGKDYLIHLCATRSGTVTFTEAGAVARGQKGVPPPHREPSLQIPDVLRVVVGKQMKPDDSGADRVTISVKGGGRYVYEVSYNPLTHIGL